MPGSVAARCIACAESSREPTAAPMRYSTLPASQIRAAASVLMSPPSLGILRLTASTQCSRTSSNTRATLDALSSASTVTDTVSIVLDIAFELDLEIAVTGIAQLLRLFGHLGRRLDPENAQDGNVVPH